jgi:hypothetical protein
MTISSATVLDHEALAAADPVAQRDPTRLYCEVTSRAADAGYGEQQAVQRRESVDVMSVSS